MVEEIRSFDCFTRGDLKRLAEIAEHWLGSISTRLPTTCGLYRDRSLLVALCQCGAEHYLSGKRGVKDLDVWTFFRNHPAQAFPYRTVWHADFGASHFGKNPADKNFVGRRVDLIGRSIASESEEEPVAVVRRWLTGHSKSAQRLAERPVIALTPAKLAGKVIWQPNERVSNRASPRP